MTPRRHTLNSRRRTFARNVESYCIVQVVRLLLLVDVVIRYLHWSHIEV
jgi:hypothetical protein